LISKNKQRNYVFHEQDGKVNDDTKKDNSIDILGKQILTLVVKEIRKIVQKMFVSLGYTSIINNEMSSEIFESIGENIGGQLI